MRRPVPSSSAPIRIVAFVAAIAALSLAKTVLLPVAIAVLLAFALAPIVRWLERPLRYRPLAIGVTIALTALAGAGLVAFAVGQARDFIDKSPDYAAALTKRLSSTRAGATALHRALRDVQTAAELPTPETQTKPAFTPFTPSTPPPPTTPTTRPEQPTNLFDVAGQVLQAGAVVLITTLLLAVVLRYREDLRDRLVRTLGVESLPLTRRTLEDASQRLSQYLLSQAGLNALCGVLIGSGMFILGLPNPALMGIVAGMLRFVPYLGPLTAATIAFLTALATSPDWTTPLAVLAIYAGVESLIALVLEPWLYGKRSGLSLFGVVVAISFWGWLWGIPGLLVAVPLTLCVVLLARHFPALEPLSILLGDAPPLTPADRFHHRLLSSDVPAARATLTQAAAAPDAPPDAIEEIWLSSLRRAAADVADDRLTDPDLDAYFQTARDLLVPAEPSTPAPIPPTSATAASTTPTTPAVILFTSSNHLDTIAAEVIRACIARRTDVPVRVIDPPVMLTELVGSEAVQQSRALVVLSIARSSRRRASLLARGLHSRIPAANVILAALAGPRPDSPPIILRGIRYVRTLTELSDALGIPIPAPPPTEDPGANGDSKPRADSGSPGNDRVSAAPSSLPARRAGSR